ncbi:crossover junction endodeoxyribonuclease RuvC [Bacillus inaquosorum]|uniref:crossover junction endodeoxyribonuclease RuvC n=1 Tax=Bacillus inaquosorum TaxID=483913 RepID=UPI002282725F|nr:crossover junction endodeoxyribonuclease RuvC [Bacillus inaquosorum]MCY9308838.1 crossover junction endodeoxyribonuclease RuvC [Bacillus inaquosorum]
MYYLGLDPSTKCTGHCLMDEKHNLIDFGKIVLPSDATEAGKILYQCNIIESILQKYDVSHILIEDQFAGPNRDTYKKLTRTSGALLYLAEKYGIPYTLLQPTSWRKVFHGSGKAKKTDTFDKVIALYGEELGKLEFKHDNDLTDSVGIAWSCVDLNTAKAGAAA